MEWPAQYPDLNSIEHLWNILKCKLNKYEEPPKGLCELWDRSAEEWNKITPKDCQNLIESLPRRLEAVYEAKEDIQSTNILICILIIAAQKTVSMISRIVMACL